MTHNREFILATRGYDGLLAHCRESVTKDPNKALENCSDLRLDLSADTRLRGQPGYSAAILVQLDGIEELAKDVLYHPAVTSKSTEH